MRDLLERLEARDDREGVVPGADEVFVKASSHRGAREMEKLLGREPQQYYSFHGPQATAGTSYVILKKTELAKVKEARLGKGIKGVDAYMPRGGLKKWLKTWSR